MATVSAKTLERVKDWFKQNPQGTGQACAKALGLSTGTVSAARRELGISPTPTNKERKAPEPEDTAPDTSKQPKKEEAEGKTTQGEEEGSLTASTDADAEERTERMTLMLKPSVRQKLELMATLTGNKRGGMADVVERLIVEAFPKYLSEINKRYK